MTLRGGNDLIEVINVIPRSIATRDTLYIARNWKVQRRRDVVGSAG
jgi:hypothetical protein